MSSFNPFDDIDPLETGEWLESIDSVLSQHGPERAHFLLNQMIDFARRSGAYLPYSPNTAYLNTIGKARQPEYPGDRSLERRIEAYLRWNAMAMVVNANRVSTEYGGHISSYASSATLYEVGFNHFWRGATDKQEGDMVFMQGHSSPGIYARAFLEGRLSEQELNRFRQEVGGGGLSSYPHPWLMPDFWQFPTVSMGLGPMMAIYQARFMRYMEHRGLIEPTDRKVWCFCGDGEMDEPESMGAITMPVREGLDNLVFVVNCNLQRLDGPVRGNGKIIQELEGVFRGAGWNVIKVIWGRKWDPLLEKDKTGLLQKRMDEVCDGELQNYKYNGGAYTREHFFGKYPELLELVSDLSDDDIMYLNRGGHDPYKVYAAYAMAVEEQERPTAILAMTVKGYGTGEAGEANNETHSLKKLDIDSLKAFRDRFAIPISDAELKNVPYYRPAPDSPEMRYMCERRQELGGQIPARRAQMELLKPPPLSAFSNQLKSSGKREISTTMAFVRMLSSLVKDKEIGERVVPIVPDEARTFGMEGMFRQLGIYSSVGQRYTPHDAGQIMFYKEDKQGQILEEGINEAGAFSAWLAAATSYSTSGYAMVPFYIYYSMFGFQRIGDLAWAAGECQARGFLIGGTAGRTTLNGEGLQHQDGHSLLLSSTIPNCVSYDPAYAYELAVILQDGLRRMYEEGENKFYYITTMNENYVQPDMPQGAEAGIIQGMYQLKRSNDRSELRVQLLGGGTILREVEAAAVILENDYQIAADVWSLTSVNELQREGKAAARWNMLHPQDEPRVPYVTRQLQDAAGPFIAATDYMKSYADQIREFVPGRYTVLGTDGFGRSDTRSKLREFFEVSRQYIVIAALSALADEGKIEGARVDEAMRELGVQPDKHNPLTV